LEIDMSDRVVTVTVTWSLPEGRNLHLGTATDAMDAAVARMVAEAKDWGVAVEPDSVEYNVSFDYNRFSFDGEVGEKQLNQLRT
jgi:hypothetical protein